MKVEKIIKKKNNQYQIILSDKTSLSFYDDTIIKYNLLSKKEIDTKKLEEIINYNNEVNAYYDALKYINSKLRTKKEIENKLSNNNYNKYIINKTIARLEEQKYLNDEFYIKSYINDQINLSLKGPKKIVYELEKLGFKSNEIEKYINEDICFWQGRIKKIIERKIKSNRNYSKIILQKKLKQDLQNMGYTSNLVGSLVDNIDYKDNEDILKKEILKGIRKYSKKYQGRELELKLKEYLYKKGFKDNIDVDVFDDCQ